jgi:competence ComEA-like helix-hairpin-helix protein
MTPTDKAPRFDLSWSRPNTAAVLAGCVLFAGLLLSEHLSRPYVVGEQIPLWGPRIRAATELINPNTAAAGSLQRLPGIGPSRASAIIAYRQGHGPVAFHMPADLMAISGIGPATARNVAPHLTFQRQVPTQTAPARPLIPSPGGS